MLIDCSDYYCCLSVVITVTIIFACVCSVQTLKITRDWFRVRASIVTMFMAAGLLYYTAVGSRKEYAERMEGVEKQH
jgi:NO-binding membrane sensor protein with MHYT domain